MKNGLTVDAPVTKEISGAVAWAIKVVAVTTMIYGIAHLISVIRWW